LIVSRLRYRLSSSTLKLIAQAAEEESMNWAWRRCLSLSFVIIPTALTGAGSAAPEQDPKTPLVRVHYPSARPSNLKTPSSITVRTYNLANAPKEDLVQATYVAGQIFKQAGIKIRWLSCALSLQEARTKRACEEAIGRDDFDVIVSTASITRPGVETDASLGFAFPLERRSHAVVLWERSRKMAEGGGVPVGIVLGNTLAHELGHVLLHSMEHSQIGIMRSTWGKEDLLRAKRCGLLFTTGQAKAMRDELMK
jgi:hypothetical protein